MATIIDRLVIEFGLDPKGYDRGSKQVREATKKVREESVASGKDMEASSKRAAYGLNNLRNEAVGLFLAFAGANGVKSFVTTLLSGDAATSRLAANIGLATSELGGWQIAVRKAGGEASDADASLKSLAATISQKKLQGVTGVDPQLIALGVRPGDMTDAATLAKALSENRNNLSRENYFQLLGQVGLTEGFINLLVKKRAEVERDVSAGKKQADSMEENARRAKELEKKLVDLQEAIKNKTRPALIEMSEAILDLDAKYGIVNLSGPIFYGTLVAIGVGAARALGPIGLLAAAVAVLADKYDVATKGADAWASAFLRMDKWYSEVRARAQSDPKKRMEWLERAQADAAAILEISERANRPGNAGGRKSGQFGIGSGGTNDPMLAMIRKSESRGDYNAQAYDIGNGKNAAGLERKDLLNMTLGEVFDYQRGAMRAKTRGHRGPKDVGSTGVGAYQFESLTLREHAMALYGSNWRNQKFSVATQDALAAHQLPTATPKTWAVLGKARPPAGSSRGGVQTNTASVGVINVYTAATDAKGIAAELPGAIARRGLTTQANRGLD